MNQPLYVDTDGVTSLADIHGQVAAAMARLAGSAPDEAALRTAYGTISSAFTSALGEALPSRDGTFRSTQASGQTISELLQRAAQSYEQGDREGGEKLTAAAEALEGSGGAGRGSTGSAGAAGGADTSAQLAGQVGQQVGQIAGGLAQSVQGLAQGLTSLPQQVLQGVQGLAGSPLMRAGSGSAKGGEKDEDHADDAEERTRDEKRAAEIRADEQAAPTRGDGAQPGRAAEQGRAPEAPTAPKPAPAQTRPQQGSL